MFDNYYTKQIKPFVVNLVENFVDAHGYTATMALDDLADTDISTFVAILLAENPGDANEIIWNDETYPLCLAALRSTDKEEQLIFAEKQLALLIKFFEPRMEKILTSVHENMVMEFKETSRNRYE
jgi:hypothetical protein